VGVATEKCVLVYIFSNSHVCNSRVTLRLKKLLYGFIPIKKEYELVEMSQVRE